MFEIKNLSKEYFAELASRLYLSPSEEILEKCVKFADEIKDDLCELMSFDTKNIDIFYTLPEVKISLNTPQYQEKPENEDILKSLLSGYELPNIHNAKQEES